MKSWQESSKNDKGKCIYVSFMSHNSCFINLDVLDMNQVTVKTFDIRPLSLSSAWHTSQVSHCPSDVSSALDCGACESAGIQREAKFRPLTWPRTQGSSGRGTSGIPEDTSVTQRPTPWPFRNLYPSILESVLLIFIFYWKFITM